MSNQGSQHMTNPSQSDKFDSKTIDPVCGMTVNPETAKGKRAFESKTYYFCSLKCKAKFDVALSSFLIAKPMGSSLPKVGVPYTCPMHPEIRQIGPGSCPICGMALEPVTASLEHEKDDSDT
ncbi:MAG: YHS domain-containing protein [Chitinophagaceae bacterium]|nr:YHS domain-containing protein [Oligoflexus sp.]